MPSTETRSLVGAMVLVAVVTAVWAAVAIPARATSGARTTADEPQYLLTALSIAEGGDLDISDEIEARSYLPFHEITIDPQTELLEGGRQLSPHDPLLPIVLAPAMRLGGWQAAKATLAVLAGTLAASLVWVAVRRFDVALPPAVVVTLAFSLSAPLTTFGTQVYPEVPAALCVTWGIALVTSRLGLRHLGALVLVVSALPWLGVKYAAVAAVLAGVGLYVLWQDGRRRDAVGVVLALLVSGAAFLVVHRLLYGGWTVYASGDHFADTGELSVVGSDPDYLGRTRRLTGLVVDAHFGLAAWAPVYLLAVASMGALLRRRPPGWIALVAPLAAGWATATWVALTMHGWWFPGRQVVVVLPCLVLATAWWAGRDRRVAWVAVGLGLIGLVLWGWTLAETLADHRTLIVDVATPAGALARVWRSALPDGLAAPATEDALLVLWSAGLVALGGAGWLLAGRKSVGGDEDAAAGEVADTDVVARDLDSGRPVG